MTYSRFTEKATWLLRFAGWYPGRSVKIEEYEKVSEENGVGVLPVVREFMQEFYGLRIIWPISLETGFLEAMVINAESAKEFDQEDQEEYLRRIGKPICGIGYIEGDPQIVLMDSEGRVYIEQMEYLALIGNTGTEALENLVTSTADGPRVWKIIPELPDEIEHQ